MKKVFFCFIVPFIFLFNNQSSAQLPEKIYGKNKVLKPNEYYLEQMALWKKETDKNSKDANAWYNYYRASRNAYVKGEEDNSRNSKGKSRFDRLNGIVEEMEKVVSASYEYNFVRWLNGNNDMSLFPYLEKAHSLSPGSSEPIMSLIFYYEIKGDYAKRDEFIDAYCRIGDHSPGLLNYGYNVLSALNHDAVVFTEGDKDTEAILLLTRGKKYRPDVRMFNVNLLLIKDYRERVFNEYGIPQLDYEPMENGENYKKFQQSIIQHVASNNQMRPVYSSVTVSNEYAGSIRNELYLTGLAYLYSKQVIENIPQLVRNVEHRFLLDYLTEYFPLDDISVGNVQSMNGNYLVPFTELSQYYFSMGNPAKSEYYRMLAQKVAIAADRLTEYETLISR